MSPPPFNPLPPHSQSPLMNFSHHPTCQGWETYSTGVRGSTNGTKGGSALCMMSILFLSPLPTVTEGPSLWRDYKHRKSCFLRYPSVCQHCSPHSETSTTPNALDRSIKHSVCRRGKYIHGKMHRRATRFASLSWALVARPKICFKNSGEVM